MDTTAPVVLNRFQYRENRMVGRFADAAMANARETRNATFWDIARMPRTIETMPRITTVMRETRTCSSSVASPSRITEAYTSCAMDAEAVMARPETTASTVAKATAEISAMKKEPPSSNASSGAAEFAPPGAARMRSGPTRAAAA